MNRETAFSQPGEGCPAESKVGTIEVETPVLAEKALGAVYVAKPFANPYDNLLTLYVVAKIPSRGIIVKTAGKVEPNPVTGQLTTTFDNSPQVPFNKFDLEVQPGRHLAALQPADLRHLHRRSRSHPLVRTGRPSPRAQLLRNDRRCPQRSLPIRRNPALPSLPDRRLDQQRRRPVLALLHPPDPRRRRTGDHPLLDQAAAGSAGQARRHPTLHRRRGRPGQVAQPRWPGGDEEADPSCPAASAIGHTYVEAGVGSTLARAPGKIYLAGSYHGSAISIVSITNARVGPFDLGTSSSARR